MKIAILKTYEDIAEDIDLTEKIFQDFLKHPSFQIDFFNVMEFEYPKDDVIYDMHIVTGSAYSVHDKEEWIVSLCDYIRKTTFKQLLGICFGHQVIAHALGGKVEEVGWHVGVKPLNLYQDGKHPAQCLNVCYNHQDQVVTLPPGGECIGGNDYCNNAMYVIGDTIHGWQFHPEFTHQYHTRVINRLYNREAMTHIEFEQAQIDINQLHDGNYFYQLILEMINSTMKLTN